MLTVRQFKNRYAKRMTEATPTKDSSTDYQVYDYLHLQLEANTNGLASIREHVQYHLDHATQLTERERSLLQAFMTETKEED